MNHKLWFDSCITAQNICCFTLSNMMILHKWSCFSLFQWFSYFWCNCFKTTTVFLQMLEFGLEICLVGWAKSAALNYHEQKPLSTLALQKHREHCLHHNVCTFTHKVIGPKSEGMEIQVWKRNWGEKKLRSVHLIYLYINIYNTMCLYLQM